MPGKGCKSSKDCSGSSRAHTPITSEAQQGMFGAQLSRRRKGKQSRMKGITTKELESHLHESKGKNLPGRASGKGDHSTAKPL